MKTLVNFNQDKETRLNFTGTNQAIKDWVQNNLSRFKLNEEHSCTVELKDNEITISGDEDLLTLNIEPLQIINLD